MRDGRIVQVGCRATVYDAPVDAWAARLTGPVSQVGARVSDLRDGHGRIDVAGVSQLVAMASAGPAAGEVVALIRPDWVHLGGDIPARVDAVAFRGTHTDYEASTGAGAIWIRAAGPPTVGPGAAVASASTASGSQPSVPAATTTAARIRNADDTRDSVRSEPRQRPPMCACVESSTSLPLARHAGETAMSVRQTQPADDGTPHHSIGRRAEEIASNENEAGRKHTGTKGETERPTGESSARYHSGIDPKEPMTQDRPEK